MNSSSSYGAPPPPPPPIAGNIPGRRIQTQMPAEPPACVQNAMMTKDKKPFTYTPAGIDLSQIKSPRMARRIARNANAEGVTGQPKPSPLAQPTSPTVQPPTPTMPASAMGMPFQVFPTGGAPKPPPPPPPQQQNGNKAPPNSNIERNKSPQSFEPPPLGCRPEIKIPPNPMAALRPVPKPKPKDDFWVEEYRRERSKSPLVSSREASEQPSAVEHSAQPSQPNMSMPAPVEQSVIALEQKRVESPKPVPQVHTNNIGQSGPTSPVKKPEISEKPAFLMNQKRISPNRNIIPQESQPNRVTSPQTINQTQNHSRPQPVPETNSDTPLTIFNNVAPKVPAFVQQQQLNNRMNNQVNSTDPASNSPVAHNANHQNGQDRRPLSPPSKQTQLGSLYIPPVNPQDHFSNKQQQQPVSQNTPPWMQSRHAPASEVPDWANRDQVDTGFSFQQQQPQQQQQPTQRPVQTVQYSNQSQATTNSQGHKERIIPIQLEQTPTPTKTPMTPGFGPQPFYNVANQYSSVQSPGNNYHCSSPTISPSIHHNPNQFVDQGYNNFPPQQQQNSYQGPGRDMNENAFNNVRGPISQSPTVFQRDPTSDQNWGNMTPNQSKSFRILQKITDTIDMLDNADQDQPSEMKQPHFSRQMEANAEQMRKIQLNDHDRALMNSVKNQVDSENYLHTEEDPRYRGAAIPSKAFKLLQNMTDKGDSTGQVQIPVQQPRNQKFVQQRAMFQDGTNAQYIPPSEQQAPEPRKYMGSAIPSRSFKILQASFTPENAADYPTADIEQTAPNYSDYPNSYCYYDPNYASYDNYPYDQPYFPYNKHQTLHDEAVRRTPSIVITPTPEDQNQEPFIHLDLNPLATLSQKLENLSSSDNIIGSRQEKIYVGDDQKMPSNEVESEDSDASETDSESDTQNVEKPSHTLKAIRSVTNIHVYDQDSETNTPDRSPDFIEEEDSEDDTTEVDEELTMDEVGIIPHQLSVILEESDKTKTSTPSSTSSSTDCSTTIANDSDSEDTDAEDNLNEDEEDQDLDDEDVEEETSVTVRLPLKVSFSRSSNNEEITTVVVGNSEVKDEPEKDTSKSFIDVFETRRSPIRMQNTLSDADVSVTFSINSRSNSTERFSSNSLNLSKTQNSSEDDVSVSVSLPMIRNKFSSQNQSLDTLENIIDKNKKEIKTEDEETETEGSEEEESEDEESEEEDESDKEEINDKVETKKEEEEQDDEIDDIWGENSPVLPRRAFPPHVAQVKPLIEETESESESESESDDEEAEHETQSLEGNMPVDSKKNLIKYEISEVENYLQKYPYYPITIDLIKASSPQVSYIPIPSPIKSLETIDNLPRLRQRTVERCEENIASNVEVRRRISESMPKLERPVSMELNQDDSEKKINVRDRIAAFENVIQTPLPTTPTRTRTESPRPYISDRNRGESPRPYVSDRNRGESPRPYISDRYRGESPRPDLSLRFRTESPKPEPDRNSKTENPKPEINRRTNAESPKPDFNRRFNTESPKPELSSRSESSSSLKTESIKPQISQRIRTESPRPELRKLVHTRNILANHKSLNHEESADEDDSGVTSDHSRQISDSESENFPELHKMSRYQRAATHSRLFKLLHDECDEDDLETNADTAHKKAYNPKKIVHNVSITRKTNPTAIHEAETMAQRRERLSLPLENNRSLDLESNTSSTSSTSPINVSDQLVNELIQSFMKKKKSHLLRNMSMDKLHAAAKRVLSEDLEFDSVISSSQDEYNSTVDSTPALTPQEFKNGYSEYYESFNQPTDNFDYDILPSKAFKNLHEQSMTGQRRFWGTKCPRVLSSKSIHRDLGRVTEIRESESPEPSRMTPTFRSSSSSISSKSPTPTVFSNGIYRGPGQSDM